MRAIILLAIFVASQCHINQPFITREHVEEISRKSSFETYTFENHPFKNWSEADLRSLLGTIVKTTKPTEVDLGENCDAPESFDGRVQWPSYVHRIRNQENCGSCWAFAASEVLSDRFAIATQGQVNVVLSPEDLVDCDTRNYGCNGGYLDVSWDYIVNSGIVSDDCLPYTSGGGTSGQCPTNDFNNHRCPSGATFRKFHASSYTQFTNNCDVKKSLMNEGPVETAFLVFTDFFSYSGGVYVSSCESMAGAHAVKIVGWGVENGDEYWIIANSWGSAWGENGYIRVKTGQSCLNLDTQVIAGHADVSRLMREEFSN